MISRITDQESGGEVYNRDCADTTSYECRDFQGDGEGEFIHECVCQGEGCNKDWSTAGDTEDQTTTDNPVLNVKSSSVVTTNYLPLQCYVCRSQLSPLCDESNPGPLESCPADESSGCLISRETDQSSGIELYTRSCADTSSYECRDFQGDGADKFIHECVCQGEGCNKDWGSAGEATTPDGVQKRVRSN